MCVSGSKKQQQQPFGRVCFELCYIVAFSDQHHCELCLFVDKSFAILWPHVLIVFFYLGWSSSLYVELLPPSLPPTQETTNDVNLKLLFELKNLLLWLFEMYFVVVCVLSIELSWPFDFSAHQGWIWSGGELQRLLPEKWQTCKQVLLAELAKLTSCTLPF